MLFCVAEGVVGLEVQVDGHGEREMEGRLMIQ